MVAGSGADWAAQLTDRNWSIRRPPGTACLRNISLARPLGSSYHHMIMSQNETGGLLIAAIIGVLSAVHQLCRPLHLTFCDFRGLVPKDDRQGRGILTESQPVHAAKAFMFTDSRPDLIGPVSWDHSNTVPLARGSSERIRGRPVLIEIYDRIGEWQFTLMPFCIALALEELRQVVHSLQHIRAGGGVEACSSERK